MLTRCSEKMLSPVKQGQYWWGGRMQHRARDWRHLCTWLHPNEGKEGRARPLWLASSQERTPSREEALHPFPAGLLATVLTSSLTCCGRWYFLSWVDELSCWNHHLGINWFLCFLLVCSHLECSKELACPANYVPFYLVLIFSLCWKYWEESPRSVKDINLVRRVEFI